MFGNGSTNGNTIIKDIPTIEIFTTLIVVVITVISEGVIIADGE